ncbi:MAG: type VI secretion system-associated protein TagF [Rhodospirillales bacterium]|nr:type VI secretion system-associated protein TagF [Rhodospirillales bacterium]
MPGSPLDDRPAETAPAVGSDLGFYGKIPASGDFVRRGLPAEFVQPWDDWLAAAVHRSQEELGAAWLDCYLTSPIWRFAMAASVCGSRAAVGVLTPSVDAVNRHFPVVIAALLPDTSSPLRVLEAGDGWYEAVEHLALAALDPGCDATKFGGDLLVVGPPPLVPSSCALDDRGLSKSADAAMWGLRIAPGLSAARGADLVVALLDTLSGMLFAGWSLWWTSGSDHVEPVLRIHRGLPPAEDYTAMLRDRHVDAVAELFDTGRPSR